jgi:hypothetical protein
MALLKAVQVAAKYPVPSAAGGVEVIAIVGDYTIKTGDAAGDVIEMCPLPAGYVPVDIVIDNQALAATSVGNVGLMSGNYGESGARTVGAEFNSAANFATAGIKRMDVAGSARIAPTTNDRSVGIVLTSLTTPTVGNRVRLTLFARAQSWGV